MDNETMPARTAIHATLHFEREIAAPVGEVFSAFEDASARAVWSVSANDTLIYDSHDFREGQDDRFRCGPKDDPNIDGKTHYFEIVRNRRIVASEELGSGGMRLAVSLITTEFRDLGNTTKVECSVQIVSFVGQEMIRGYEDGHQGALNGLSRFFGNSPPARR